MKFLKSKQKTQILISLEKQMTKIYITKSSFYFLKNVNHQNLNKKIEWIVFI